MRTDRSTRSRLEKVQRGVAISAFISVVRNATHGALAANWQTAKAVEVVDSQFRRLDNDPGADSQFCGRTLQSSATRNLVRTDPAFPIGGCGRNRVNSAIRLEI